MGSSWPFWRTQGLQHLAVQLEDAPCGCSIPGAGSLPSAVVRYPETQVGGHLTRKGNQTGLPAPLSHRLGWNISSLVIFKKLVVKTVPSKYVI